jgi:hypothetical protein
VEANMNHEQRQAMWFTAFHAGSKKGYVFYSNSLCQRSIPCEISLSLACQAMVFD